MQTIRECPFCGGDAIFSRVQRPPTVEIVDCEYVSSTHHPHDGHIIECIPCGARSPHDYTEPPQSREQAIDAWNRRVQDENDRR